MSYISQTGCSFHIDKSKFTSLVQKAARLFPHKNFAMREQLEDVFEAFHFDMLYDNDGNCCNIVYQGQASDGEKGFLDAIAPFVTPCSYIEFEGEHDAKWRYVFTGKEILEDYPVVLWASEQKMFQVVIESYHVENFKPDIVSELLNNTRECLDRK